MTDNAFICPYNGLILCKSVSYCVKMIILQNCEDHFIVPGFQCCFSYNVFLSLKTIGVFV